MRRLGRVRVRVRPALPARAALGLAVCLTAASAVCLAGCGDGRAQSAHPASAPAGAPTGSPADTAVAYMTALYSGHPDTAAHYIRPESRRMFLYLSKGVSPTSVRAAGLRAARTVVRDGRASVTLTGTICVLNPSAPASAPPDQKKKCASHPDAQQPDPLFQVALTHTSQHWYVAYEAPAGASPSAG